MSQKNSSQAIFVPNYFGGFNLICLSFKTYYSTHAFCRVVLFYLFFFFVFLFFVCFFSSPEPKAHR